MFCAFAGAAKILRLHGRGSVVEPHDAGFAELAVRFPAYNNARAVIRVDLTRIADSCGYGVPLYDHQGHRDTLLLWADRRGPEGLKRYISEKNCRSLDGLPALAPSDAVEAGD